METKFKINEVSFWNRIRKLGSLVSITEIQTKKVQKRIQILKKKHVPEKKDESQKEYLHF